MSKLYIKTTVGTKGSRSAKRVADALTKKLGYKVWRSTKEFPKKKALKYGQGVGKLSQYQWFVAQGIPCLTYTDQQDEADKWFKDGQVVFARHLLNSSCGKGITVFDPDKECISPGKSPKAPVYTLYKKKKREFRVHIFKDKVVRVVEKKLRSNWNGPKESKIRNLANGYVFCSCIDEPTGLRELAIKASGVVSSDFRGVDVGYNEKQQQLFVIEVNSAPGIEGSNVEAYVGAINGV